MKFFCLVIKGSDIKNKNWGILDSHTNIGKLDKKICRKLTRKTTKVYNNFFKKLSAKKLWNFLNFLVPKLKTPRLVLFA